MSAAAALRLLPPGSSTEAFIVSKHNLQKVENLLLKDRTSLCQRFLQLINDKARKMVKLAHGGFEELSLYLQTLNKMLD